MNSNNINANEFVNCLIEAGEYFGFSRIFTIPAGDSFYFLIKTGQNYTHIASIFRSVQLSTLELFVGGSFSNDGTAIVPVNFSVGDSNISGLSAFYTPTITNPGSGSTSYLIPAGSGKGSIGASSEAPRHIILPPNTNILFKFTDIEASNQGSRLAQLQVNFYETSGRISQVRDFK